MQKFDLWLIETIFEKFSHFWQKLTGKDCFWLARASFVLCALMFVLAIKIEMGISLEAENIHIPFWILLIKAPPLIMALFLAINDCEEDTKKSHLKGLANPSKVEDSTFYIRVLCLLSGVLLLMISILSSPTFIGTYTSFIFMMGSIILLSSVILYFCSCDPLPPGRDKSKIRQWLESTVDFFTQNPDLTPAPISR